MSSPGKRYHHTYQGDHNSENDTSTEASTDVDVAYRRPGQNVRGKLPPLETGNRLPPVDPAFRVSEVGTAQTPQTIISLPGGDGPQAQKLQSVGMPRIGSHSSQQKPLEVVVYFMDKTGIHLVVDDGQNCQAGELFEMVREEMKFPESSREVFSLWLVSDLLEVQLKPNQVPFKLACYWEELLEKYTTAEEDDIERDEAVIMFQRNVFYPRSKETQLADAEILRLLYHEAKESVVDARYPLQREQYENLAGLQALINHREFDQNVHTPEYYKPILAEYFPEFLANKKKWSLFRGKDCPEYRLADCHNQAYQSYGKLSNVDSRKQCYRAYLDFCWKLPFYGAAFFRGQIEHPGSKMRLTSLDDDPVYVAINTEGIFIIDMDDVKFLLGLLFNQFSWEYAEPRDQENKNCMPCLFIRFGDKENGEPVTKMLQIFSREAVLMDSMIEACIQLKSASNTDTEDQIDGVIESTGETWKEFSRLCLATFNRNGQLVKSTARTPKKK